MTAGIENLTCDGNQSKINRLNKGKLEGLAILMVFTKHSISIGVYTPVSRLCGCCVTQAA